MNMNYVPKKEILENILSLTMTRKSLLRMIENVFNEGYDEEVFIEKVGVVGSCHWQLSTKLQSVLGNPYSISFKIFNKNLYIHSSSHQLTSANSGKIGIGGYIGDMEYLKKAEKKIYVCPNKIEIDDYPLFRVYL